MIKINLRNFRHEHSRPNGFHLKGSERVAHLHISVQLLQLRSQWDDKLILADLHCGGMGFHVQGNKQVIEALTQWSTHVLGLDRVQKLLLINVKTQSVGGTEKER